MKNHAPDFFVAKAKSSVPLYLIGPADLRGTKHKALRDLLLTQGFDGGAGQVAPLFDGRGQLKSVYLGITRPLSAYALAPLLAGLGRLIDAGALKKTVFRLEIMASPLDDAEKVHACLGYALGGYQFTAYKPKARKTWPKIIWPQGTDTSRAQAMIDAIFMARDLINTPANDMGPNELVAAATILAENHGAKIKALRGDDLLKANFPLIHAVGRASSRPPALIDLRWGNPKHPRLTLVGKGVVFDTGGLDIKPSSGMLIMKKDMGGAAHVLALSHMIMALEIPVCLRVLCPVAENAVSGNAFRPKDIITARNGLTIEIGNTDAEGRLLLADALAEAATETPDLLIDMATLTGAAHVAVGHHIASFFAHKDTTAQDLMERSTHLQDPMWRMPLWDSYRKSLGSAIADLNSTGDPNPAGSITAALFLDRFVPPSADWIHIDFCAWEYTGRPGRPAGGSEFALRALLSMIEARYPHA